MIKLDESLKTRGLEVARGIADWVTHQQSPWVSWLPTAGTIPSAVTDGAAIDPAASWNYAFTSMGLAGAARVFREPRYRAVCDTLMRVLSSFQILDPFHEEHYGAIREYSAVCPWCYTRDAVSGGWGFLEYYRLTGDDQYLKRARFFMDWLVKKGLDGEGFPWFGVMLDADLDGRSQARLQNDILGNFQGGSLNFFYQMYKATGDRQWVDYMKPIADIFVDHIQQESGYFVCIRRDTKKPPDETHYARLHRGNDDLGTLGLLGMYEVSGENKYLDSIEKFLNAVWADQREDGFFEDSVAASPVVLNITWLVRDRLALRGVDSEKFNRAVAALLNATCDDRFAATIKGALREQVSGPTSATMRANGYALILLLKLFGGVEEYLCV